MRIPLFHVDAFAHRPFSGNPAAVCILDSWLDDDSLRKVAAENNLSATAFLVPQGETYGLRWFTTRCEIRLCGHATMAAGLVILKRLHPTGQIVGFETKHGGILEVWSQDDFLQMNFPAMSPKPHMESPGRLLHALGLESNPTELLEVNDTLIAVFDNERTIARAIPDFGLLEQLHPFAVAITAPGETVDFVSRYFAPSYGVLEDPVTGSAHCALTPYWAKRLGKSDLHARQISERGGELWCEMAGERIYLKGKAILTMQGSLTI